MASKRFQKKVYECWALEGDDAQLRPTDGAPYLYATRRDAFRMAYPSEVVAPVRVTVERIDKRKKVK